MSDLNSYEYRYFWPDDAKQLCEANTKLFIDIHNETMSIFMGKLKDYVEQSNCPADERQ